MMFLFIFQLVFYRGIGTLREIYIINIGVDMTGMIMGAVIYICCLIDIQKSGEEKRYLLALVGVAYVGLFADACSWLVDGIPAWRLLNIADNTLFYFVGPLEAFFFWMYTRAYLNLNSDIIKLTEKALKIGFIAVAAIRIINIFTGIYFTVDESGIYERSPLYPLSMLYILLVLVSSLAMVIAVRSRLKRYQRVSFFIYGLSPVGAAVITVFSYGLSVNQIVVMLSILVMYCILNVSEGIERAVADRDLSLSADIQLNALPRTFPYLPERKEFDIYASMDPAKEVGGDFYDFFMVDEDHIAIVIADVSGKGMPASLFMMVSIAMIKDYALINPDPSEVLYNVNNRLCDGNVSELFVTVWMGIIDLRTGEGIAANAGHEHPVIKRAGGKYELVIYKHSPAVATIENIYFRNHEFKLNHGDTLYVYTDGVPEATNAYDELYGTDRMLDALNSTPHDTPVEDILKTVRTSVDEFVGDAPQFDDLTHLAFKFF